MTLTRKTPKNFKHRSLSTTIKYAKTKNYNLFISKKIDKPGILEKKNIKETPKKTKKQLEKANKADKNIFNKLQLKSAKKIIKCHGCLKDKNKKQEK